MPLDKLVLILVVVITAAAATVYVASLLVIGFALPLPAMLALLMPVALVAYVIVRVLRDRLQNKEDDHYDSIEH
jgi:membrane protein implicated in regulation of membrane protease activity